MYLISKSSLKPLLQKCGSHLLSADCSRKSTGRFRSQRIAPAKVQGVSAVSGLLPQKCRTFPQSADCSCKSAGRFRWQRIAPAEVQGVSAGSGRFRRSAGSVFDGSRSSSIVVGVTDAQAIICRKA